MKRALTTTALLALVFASGTLAQQRPLFSDEEIAAAIKAGQDKKLDRYVTSCSAGAGFGANLAGNMAGGIQLTGAFDVTTSANYGRIAFMAARAKRLYLPFSVETIPEALKTTRSIFVNAEPDKPASNGSSYRVAPPIERIVLKSKADQTKFVQPASFETETVEWGNLLGGKVSSTRAVATFSAEEFMALPKGDIDIVLITTDGERRCKIGQDDQLKVFGRPK